MLLREFCEQRAHRTNSRVRARTCEAFPRLLDGLFESRRRQCFLWCWSWLRGQPLLIALRRGLSRLTKLFR